MYAKRLNKTYPISTPQEKKAYLGRGYDIYDDNNNVIAWSPAKTVPYGEYVKLERAHKALMDLYEDLLETHEDLLKDRLNEEASKGVAIGQADPPVNEGLPTNEEPVTMDESLLANSSGSEDDFKSLHSVDEPAPKMGAVKAKKEEKK